MAITAFIARSFDPKDETRIRPILNFLETFRKAGFLCEEAEAAEVESVSAKVRRMIGEKDAFVGFFTRKYPVYGLRATLGDAISVFRGKLQPEKWSAPSWVLQESGYALSAGKKLILLREDGVDVPGLQGDLEYVPFDTGNPSAVFSKLSEMINDLLAKAVGREIKVEFIEQAERAEVKPAPAEAARDETPAVVEEEEKPSEVLKLVMELADAREKRDLSAAYKVWEAGRLLIANGKAGDMTQLFWDSWYFGVRYELGVPDGLESLRRMRRENPDKRDPVVEIARLLKDSQEHDEAAKLFLEAATLAEDEAQRAADLLAAAGQLKEMRRYQEGIDAVERALSTAEGDTKRDAVGLLYQLLKNSGQTYFAFARAEVALRENPQMGMRFELGLDYRGHGLKELGLYHFKFLHEQNRAEAGALHNLALLYSDCELPITSVRRYKGSIELGETLSGRTWGICISTPAWPTKRRSLFKRPC